MEMMPENVMKQSAALSSANTKSSNSNFLLQVKKPPHIHAEVFCLQ